MTDTRINVTKAFLPPIEEYEAYLQQIWDRVHLTNQGPLLLELEKKLESRLGVERLHFVTNGTLALQVALRALDITEGEVITTPFSYVATVSSILWERCTPVFVDIEADTLSIDSAKIEAAITDNTRAIMPVHVFGNPCDVDGIEAIAKKHNLKVIYDAAHAFGVEYKGKPILGYGDISMCSFHATKLFHTIEGGCLVVRDKEVHERLELTKRFGHHGDDHYMLGTNAKASEFQAAMGLANLKYVDQGIANRKRSSELYSDLLGDRVVRPVIRTGTTYNYAYYPVILRSEEKLLAAIKALNADNVYPRRYFYPSLNTLPYLQETAPCPIAEDVAKRIMCLPLYFDLPEEDVRRICAVLKNSNAI